MSSTERDGQNWDKSLDFKCSYDRRARVLSPVQSELFLERGRSKIVGCRVKMEGYSVLGVGGMCFQYSVGFRQYLGISGFIFLTLSLDLILSVSVSCLQM